MTLAKVVAWEGNAFLYLLCATVAYRLVTHQIRLNGLLSRAGGTKDSVSPERVQLLLMTIGMCMHYATRVAHSPGDMPDVEQHWLYLFGGSSGIYALVKAALTLKSSKGTADHE